MVTVGDVLLQWLLNYQMVHSQEEILWCNVILFLSLFFSDNASALSILHKLSHTSAAEAVRWTPDAETWCTSLQRIPVFFIYLYLHCFLSSVYTSKPNVLQDHQRIWIIQPLYQFLTYLCFFLTFWQVDKKKKKRHASKDTLKSFRLKWECIMSIWNIHWDYVTDLKNSNYLNYRIS